MAKPFPIAQQYFISKGKFHAFCFIECQRGCFYVPEESNARVLHPLLWVGADGGTLPGFLVSVLLWGAGAAVFGIFSPVQKKMT